MKTRKVCKKAGHFQASLSLRGKVTKHTTVKWTIYVNLILTNIPYITLQKLNSYDNQ